MERGARGPLDRDAGRRAPPEVGRPRFLVVDPSSAVVGALHAASLAACSGAILLPPVIDCEEAVARIERDRPDVLFLDLGMPRMTGVTVLRAIRRSRPRRVYMLAPLSAEAGVATWEALTLGAHGFLTKRGAGSSAALVPSAACLAGRLAVIGARALSPTRRRPEALARQIWSHGQNPLGSVMLLESRWLARLPSVLARYEVPDALPILLVSPHPRPFAEAFRDGLDRTAPLRVRLARSGEAMPAGALFFTSGGPGSELRLEFGQAVYNCDAGAGGDRSRRRGTLIRVDVAAGGFAGLVARPSRNLNWLDQRSRRSVRILSPLPESVALPGPAALALRH